MQDYKFGDILERREYQLRVAALKENEKFCPACGRIICKIQELCDCCGGIPAEKIENENRDRYLKIVEWARKRLTVHGWLIVSIGGQVSHYNNIERLAWNKYMA